MALDPERRRQLHVMKLTSLVGDCLDGEIEKVIGTNEGAVATLSGAQVAVLAEERHERALGGAIASAVRSSATEVHMFASESTGVLARRARLFSCPIKVWELGNGSVAPAAPSQSATQIPVPEVPELVSILQDSGLDVVAEHGIIVGEVAGLEIARIVSDNNGDRIEVGVGAHDREAFTLLHGDLPTADAIEQVAAAVRPHRMPAAEPHPLNRLGAERWLRSQLIAQPERVGAAELEPAPPPVPRTNLKEAVPAVALGRLVEGTDVVVVCAVGIDLDLIPFAADARLFLNPQAALMLVVPERDAHSILYEVAELLIDRASVVPVDDGWREWITS